MSGQFGAAGGIKSIQRGTISATNGGTGTVTVSAVDINKSVLHVSNGGGGLQASVGSLAGNCAGATLNNSTTISWTGGYTFGTPSSQASPTLYWQLVEYQ